MTPYEQNYRVPGRFEEHACTFITWPCLTSDLEIVNFAVNKGVKAIFDVLSQGSVEKRKEFWADLPPKSDVMTLWNYISEYNPIILSALFSSMLMLQLPLIFFKIAHFSFRFILFQLFGTLTNFSK